MGARSGRAGSVSTRGRRRGFALALLLIAIMVAIGTFAAEHANLLHLSDRVSLWLAVILVVLAVVGPLVAFTQQQIEQRQARRVALRRLLRLPPTEGRLPLVGTVSIYHRTGVSQSQYAGGRDTYVPRQVDDQLQAAVMSQPFVVVAGPWKAGKSRTAFEAVRAALSEAVLLVPSDQPGALQELAELDPPLRLRGRPVVVWLDELDRFVHSGGLEPGVLAAFSGWRSRVVVVGTIAHQRLARLLGDRSESEQPGIGVLAHHLLDREGACIIELPSELTAEERAAAERIYPDEPDEVFANRSIGEQLAGVHILVNKLRENADSSRPTGWAVVMAAVDWRRCGMGRPIPEPFLHELASRYLREARVGPTPTDQELADAVRWACKPVASKVALLELIDYPDDSQPVEPTDGLPRGHQENRAYQVLDYMVGWAEGQHERQARPIRPATWQWILEHVATAQDAVKVGFTAYTRGERKVARRAWEQALQGRGDAVAEAAYQLGVLLEEEQKLPGARAALQLAVDAEHPLFTTRAAVRLGWLLVRTGDLDMAGIAARRALTSEQPEVAADANRLVNALRVLDPGELLDADQDTLLNIWATAPDQAPFGVARQVLWHCLDSLVGLLPLERASVLEAAARQYGAAQLAERLAPVARKRLWSLRWLRGPVPSPHRRYRGHANPATSVAVGALGGRPMVVSCSNTDHTVRAWDLRSSAPVGEPLTDRTHSVAGVAVGELDGRPVAVTASHDNALRVWDLRSGEPVGEPLVAAADEVRMVAVGELDGRPVVATITTEHAVRVWDLRSGKWVAEPLPGRRADMLSPAVQSVAVGVLDDRPVIVTGNDDNTVRVWDLRSGEPVGEPLIGHTGWVWAVAIGVLDGRPVVVSGSTDHTVRVWDLRSGEPVGDPLIGHTSNVWAVAVGTLGSRPVVASCDDQSQSDVRVWDLRSGNESLTGHTSSVSAVAVGALDGRPVVATASLDKTMQVWDLRSGERVGEAMTVDAVHPGSAIDSLAVGVLDGGPVIVTCNDHIVRVWDLRSGELVGEPRIGLHTEPMSVAVGTLDGRPVVVTVGFGFPKTVGVWDLDSGELVREPMIVHSGGNVPYVVVGELDGRPVIVSREGTIDTTVAVWDLRSGERVGDSLFLRKREVLSVAVGALKGRPVVVTGTNDDIVRVWNLRSGELVGEPLIGHSGWVWAVAMGMLDGRPVVVSGSADHTVRVWELRSDGQEYPSLAVSPS